MSARAWRAFLWLPRAIIYWPVMLVGVAFALVGKALMNSALAMRRGL